MNDERLIIIGTGIRVVGQITMEALAWIERADKVFYIVGDPVAEELIKRLSSEATSFFHLYGEGKPRIQTYNEMIELLLNSVRSGKRTVGAFYGHPGVFAYPSHESVRRARTEGYKAKMLPGISAEDCLFADLNIDPAHCGCQSFEATDFLLNGRQIDNSSQLILWQIGVLGDCTFKAAGYNFQSAMPYLLEKLYRHYPPEHEVYVYEAATLPGVEPVIRAVPLWSLPQSSLTSASTLYVPPARPTLPDPVFYGRVPLNEAG